MHTPSAADAIRPYDLSEEDLGHVRRCAAR